MRNETLQVHKRGRWVMVAKIVKLDDEPILAVAVRHQRGTSRAVSLPLSAVAHAESRGCRWFYRRDDRAGTMGRIALADMRQRGWIGSDGELTHRPGAYAAEEVDICRRNRAAGGSPSRYGRSAVGAARVEVT